MGLTKFQHMLLFCALRGKPNTVAHLKSNLLTPPKILAGYAAVVYGLWIQLFLNQNQT